MCSCQAAGISNLAEQAQIKTEQQWEGGCHILQKPPVTPQFHFIPTVQTEQRAVISQTWNPFPTFHCTSFLYHPR